MLFEKLSDYQKDMISNYINDYAGCPNGQHSASLEYLLRFWDEEKSDYLWDLMGHEFILEKKINYTKNSTLMAENISNVLKMEGHLFEIEYLNKIIRPLRSSINWFGTKSEEDSQKISVYYALEKLMDPVTLAANFYDGVSLKVTNPKDEKHPIPLNQGCKIARVLSKIADAYDLEGYEDFRLAHSRILNDKKVAGTLCLSIHPMDYMTMSDNNSGWESCMNWQNNGCYRQGTVEMMNSPMVVVGYLKSKDDMYTDRRHQWNNKRWRCLFLVTADFITSIMAYPYPHEELTVACVNWLRELAMQNIGWRYDGNEPTTYKTSSIDIVHIDDKVTVATNGNWCDHIGLTLDSEDVTKQQIYDYIKNHPDENRVKMARFRFETYQMYNDFGRTIHFAYFNYAGILTDYALKSCESNIQNYIYYSGKSECMNCGHVEVDFVDEGQLCCTDCDDFVTCEICGDRILRNDAYEIDGMFYCETCYYDNVSSCDVCGEEHYNEDLISVNFIPASIYNFLKEIYIDKSYSWRWLNNQIAYSATLCRDCMNQVKKIVGCDVVQEDFNFYLPYDDEILERVLHDSTTSYIADCIKRYSSHIQENLSEQEIRENLYPTF